MTLKKIHHFSGLTLTVFVGLHLFNHFCSIISTEKHIEVMTFLRLFYRIFFIETILIAAVFVQIISGFQLFNSNKKNATTPFEKIQIWSGLYLAFFLIIHLSAILIGRFFLNLDTNFYFGVAGLNSFPVNLFFIPYYGLAILSFFGHIASIHYKKTTSTILFLNPKQQANTILTIGFIVMLLLFYGLTNHFQGVQIPNEYNILIGK